MYELQNTSLYSVCGGITPLEGYLCGAGAFAFPLLVCYLAGIPAMPIWWALTFSIAGGGITAVNITLTKAIYNGEDIWTVPITP